MFCKKFNLIVFVIAIIIFSPMRAMLPPVNILMPYDTLTRPPFALNKTWHLDFQAEHGFPAFGLNDCSNKVNVLDIYSCNQNALAMLQGFDANTDIGQLAILLASDGALDNGTSGRFNVKGDLHIDSFAASFRWQFLKSFFFTAYLPVYYMSLNTSWCDLTPNQTAADIAIHERLTNNFFSNVKQLGGLELGSWKRTGPGDIVAMLEWARDFEQYKPFLKNVRINWRLGANIPTGLKQDINKVFAVPFGSDGALGVIFGFGLDLSLGHNVKIGGDVQLASLFGNTRCRRIKTDPTQTEWLFLATAPAYIDYGLLQRFNLYGELGNFHGLFARIGYQFLKRGDNTLSLVHPLYSDFIANTAESLQDWTMHQIIFNTGYDFSNHLEKYTHVKPFISFFTRVPFNGKRVAVTPTIGGVIGIDF